MSDQLPPLQRWIDVIRERDAAIVAHLLAGKPAREIAAATGLSTSHIAMCGKKHEQKNGVSLPERRGRGSKKKVNLDRLKEAVAAYRELGSLKAAGDALGGLSHARVHQLIKLYERETGDRVERVGYIRMRRRVVWKCADCGETREMAQSQARERRVCRACYHKEGRTRQRRAA